MKNGEASIYRRQGGGASDQLPAIEVRGLGKRYRLGSFDERPSTLFGMVLSKLRAPLENLRRLHRLAAFSDEEAGPDVLWALKDVSFRLERGEVLGIIGPNGAGKSTLLRILSSITSPTEGQVVLRGRVASLLEVGTGFHPELTGRDNIYLNGTILGMTKNEIDRKFGEIVAFAEVERFIDTPVKRYSSGMSVRLAFSVAAHLEAEILLVDEVLAVGDVAFQNKCLGKMEDVAVEGRTVIMVSHDMAAIQRLCRRGLLVQNGRLTADGPIQTVVDQYLEDTMIETGNDLKYETESFRIDSVTVAGAEGRVIRTGKGLQIRVEMEALQYVGDAALYVAVLASDYSRLIGLDYRDMATFGPLDAGERCELGFDIESLPLMPGGYLLELYVKDMARLSIEKVDRWLRFDVAESTVYGHRAPTRWHGRIAVSAQPSSRRLPARNLG